MLDSPKSNPSYKEKSSLIVINKIFSVILWKETTFHVS
jgi:hypothetical protein